MNRFVLSALLIIGCLTGAVARDRAGGWTAYENERYGFSLRYPADLFALDTEAESGDGATFVSDDGDARLAVGALPNNEGHTPASYQRFLARKSYPGTDVDYAPRGQNWLVLSGERDRKVYYEKAMFSCGGTLIQGFVLVYPVADKPVYDPVVERIEDSFRPGRSKGCE